MKLLMVKRGVARGEEDKGRWGRCDKALMVIWKSMNVEEQQQQHHHLEYVKGSTHNVYIIMPV